MKNIKKYIQALFIVVFLYACGSSGAGRGPASVLSEFEVDDCVIFEGKEATVVKVSEQKLVSTDEYVYKIELKNGGKIKKSVIESKLSACNN